MAAIDRPGRDGRASAAGVDRSLWAGVAPLICLHAVEGLLSSAVGLLGARDCRQGPPMKRSVACFGSSGEHVGGDRFRLVQRGLLLVEHVTAEVLGSLAFVELRLVGVATVLGEAQFGLAPVG